MDLSDNNIEEIKENTLNRLPSVIEINFEYNRINEVEENSVPRSVEVLNLGSNRLNIINPKMIENLPNLKSINIKNNKLRTVPENVFKNNPMLENVLLGGNQIQSMSPKTYENLPNLKIVDLDENICVSGIYGQSAFRAMKSDISRNCDPVKNDRREDPEEMRRNKYDYNVNTIDTFEDENLQTRIVTMVDRT